jgi:hypothetical protein
MPKVHKSKRAKDICEDGRHAGERCSNTFCSRFVPIGSFALELTLDKPQRGSTTA